MNMTRPTRLTLRNALRQLLLLLFALNTGLLAVNPAWAAKRINSTTTLASSANPANAGQSVTFTATVAGSTPTGTVTFKEGPATLGTGTLSAGIASFTTSSLASGATHKIKAFYAGDTANKKSTSGELTQTIKPKVNSTTTLASSVNPSSLGQSVTFTATVTGSNPTGSVTFKEGPATLGTGTLNARNRS